MNRQLQCQFLLQPYVINRINSESPLVKLNKLTRYRNPPYIFSTKRVSLVSPLETFYRLLKLLRKNGCNTWNIDSGIQGSRLLLAGRRERAKGVRRCQRSLWRFATRGAGVGTRDNMPYRRHLLVAAASDVA